MSKRYVVYYRESDGSPWVSAVLYSERLAHDALRNTREAHPGSDVEVWVTEEVSANV